MTKRLCAIAAILFLLAGSRAWAASSAAPRFVFRVGEKLNYKLSFHAQSRGEAGEQSGAALDGGATFRVLKVQPDGTAQVELTTFGAGHITIKGESIALDSAAPKVVVLTVKPDGSIVRLQDSRGKPTSVLTPDLNFFEAATAVQGYVVGSHTMFGLQLPSRLPAPGKMWNGFQQEEHILASGGSGALDASSFSTELKRVPVTYTFLGKRQYKGVSCLALFFILPSSSASGRGSQIAETVYFDAVRGRVVGIDSQGMTSQGTMKLTVSLVTPAPAKPTPKARPAASKTAPPTPAASPAVVSTFSAPRLSFRRGQVLTYQLTYHELANPDTPQESRVDATGRVKLRVMNVQADGAAQVEVTITLKEALADGSSQATASRSQSSIITVKSNGALSAAGSLASGEGVAADLMGKLWSVVTGRKALFGLQLPAQLPAPGESWIEGGRTYVFLGPRNYKGNNYLAFSYRRPAQNSSEAAAPAVSNTIYFDAAAGQLFWFGEQVASPEKSSKILAVLTER